MDDAYVWFFIIMLSEVVRLLHLVWIRWYFSHSYTEKGFQQLRPKWRKLIKYMIEFGKYILLL